MVSVSSHGSASAVIALQAASVSRSSGVLPGAAVLVGRRDLGVRGVRSCPIVTK